MNIILTEEEMRLIEQIGADLQTGNHLLRPRSDRYWEFGKEFTAAYDAVENGTATEKQEQIVEYHKQCTDYFYWKKLPDDKKMFKEGGDLEYDY